MANKCRVLAVDDEVSILRLIQTALTSDGYDVVPANNGGHALSLLQKEEFDIVLLDVLMPNIDGFELMGKLRETAVDVPVILITALDAETDKVHGLDLGADDFIVKPFNTDELSARITAVLRRGTREGTVLRIQDLEVDFDRRLLHKGGVRLDLSATELKLLRHLALHAGRVVQFHDLLEEVWGPEYRNDSGFLRIWISRLRKKLGDDARNPTLLKTVSRVGYMLDSC